MSRKRRRGETTRSRRGRDRRVRSVETAADAEDSGYLEEFGWSEHLAFIAGFTPGGAPFGVSWEEVSGEEDSFLPPPED